MACEESPYWDCGLSKMMIRADNLLAQGVPIVA